MPAVPRRSSRKRRGDVTLLASSARARAREARRRVQAKSASLAKTLANLAQLERRARRQTRDLARATTSLDSEQARARDLDLQSLGRVVQQRERSLDNEDWVGVLLGFFGTLQLCRWRAVSRVWAAASEEITATRRGAVVLFGHTGWQTGLMGRYERVTTGVVDADSSSDQEPLRYELGQHPYDIPHVLHQTASGHWVVCEKGDVDGVLLISAQVGFTLPLGLRWSVLGPEGEFLPAPDLRSSDLGATPDVVTVVVSPAARAAARSRSSGARRCLSGLLAGRAAQGRAAVLTFARDRKRRANNFSLFRLQEEGGGGAAVDEPKGGKAASAGAAAAAEEEELELETGVFYLYRGLGGRFKIGMADDVATGGCLLCSATVGAPWPSGLAWEPAPSFPKGCKILLRGHAGAAVDLMGTYTLEPAPFRGFPSFVLDHAVDGDEYVLCRAEDEHWTIGRRVDLEDNICCIRSHVGGALLPTPAHLPRSRSLWLIFGHDETWDLDPELELRVMEEEGEEGA